MNDAVKINSSEIDSSIPAGLNESVARGEKFIVFTVQESFYGISSKEVTEIISPIAVTALPNVATWILGIMNLRGEIVPVVDLQKFWNRNSVVTPKSRFIVVRPGTSSAPIAFAVDRLSEIVILSVKEIEMKGGELPTHIFGKAVYKSSVLQLVDANRLFAALSVDK